MYAAWTAWTTKVTTGGTGESKIAMATAKGRWTTMAAMTVSPCLWYRLATTGTGRDADVVLPSLCRGGGGAPIRILVACRVWAVDRVAEHDNGLDRIESISADARQGHRGGRCALREALQDEAMTRVGTQLLLNMVDDLWVAQPHIRVRLFVSLLVHGALTSRVPCSET